MYELRALVADILKLITRVQQTLFQSSVYVKINLFIVPVNFYLIRKFRLTFLGTSMTGLLCPNTDQMLAADVSVTLDRRGQRPEFAD